MEFAGKVVLITGASSGLGKGLAQALAHQVDALILVARRGELLQTLEEEVTASACRCLSIQADLLQPEQAEAVVQKAIAQFGRIDLAIHSVGGGRPLSLIDASAQHIVGVMNNNYATLVNLFVPLLAHLRQQATPSVIAHINSLAAIVEIPRGAHYSAAKVAAQRFLDTARIELRTTPVKVLTLNPGFVQTENKKEKMLMGISLEQAVTLMLAAIAREKASYSFPWPLVSLFSLIRLLPRRVRGRLLAALSDRESGKYTED